MEPIERSENPLIAKCVNTEDVINFINNSCLSKMCPFLHKNIETVDICKGFLKLIDEVNTFKELKDLLVVGSMVYFHKQTIYNLDWRDNLLLQTFRVVNTVHPIEIHILCKHVWDSLVTKDPEYILNLHMICRRIDTEGVAPKLISICLGLKIIAEISQTKMDFFCLNKLNNLLDMLNKINIGSLKRPESTRNTFILFTTVKFISAKLVSDSELLECIYPQCLTHKTEIIKGIQEWLRYVQERLMSISRQENKYQIFNLSLIPYMTIINEFKNGSDEVKYLNMST
ncbi:uncharacterized protein LOC119670803 isoform X2 [Teleopsis dalmanni]|nr:uncharacterized protein LOC119670803 isoform X2 [Teleopsis dalmanni]